MIDISVVIPTYNRAATLHRCLTALTEQTLDRSRYEILVVDDASTDDTPSTLRQFESVRALRQSRNQGPGAARNVAIRGAAGTYVLFLDDDAIAQTTVLAQHRAAHAEVPGNHIAILGDTEQPSTAFSPLERCITNTSPTRAGLRNHIRDPVNVSFGFFNTCHLSLAREFLLHHGLFDERFPYAWGEDTELGYRLQQSGMRIVFRPDIKVQHYHPTSFSSARRRRRIAGEVAFLMAQKHPELADLSFLKRPWHSRIANWLKRCAGETLLDPILVWADRHRLDHVWLQRAYRWSLDHHQNWRLEDMARNA